MLYMDASIHALIQNYLQQQTVVSLVPDAALRQSPDRFVKAALIPFIRRAGLEYYVMQPKPAREGLPPPEFQICKGTRMHFIDGIGWRDMKEGNPAEDRRETLVETGLREGVEELGLELLNIVGLFDMGPYNFSSISTGKSRQMWVFAAEVIDASDFLPAEKIDPATDKREWIDAEEFAKTGREDHKAILADVHSRLSVRFK